MRVRAARDAARYPASKHQSGISLLEERTMGFLPPGAGADVGIVGPA